MTALDFFLYDNRTVSPRWGRDWGLKAATGVLADRADLKTAFDRYCGEMLGEQGQLSGFGEAMGGVRSPGGGYLLCVTLESSDFFGRPSWAVFGLWCPDSETLEQALSVGDPIGSACALLGSETPPRAVEIRPATIEVVPSRRRRVSAEPTFLRFDPRSTVREVISILLGAAQGRTTLPNVLGITATSRLAAVGRAGFDFVYCHPMDDRTERSLARVLSPQEPEVEEPWSPVEPTVLPAPRRLNASPSTAPEPRSFTLPPWFVWILIGIVGAVVILFLVVDGLRHYGSANSEEAPSPVEPILGGTSASETLVPEERSAEAVLGEVGERLEECKELVPEALRQSPGFVAAETLEVLPKYQESRDRVRRAYSALIDVRGRMVKRQQGNYIAYYYDEAGKDAPPAMRLQKITEILREAPLGGEDCEILKGAFGFEFEGESVVHQWCDSLESLEKTAKACLAATPPGNQTP
jgi:hypothetical protein